MKLYNLNKIFRQTAADFVAGLIIFLIVLALALSDSDPALSAPTGDQFLPQMSARSDFILRNSEGHFGPISPEFLVFSEQDHVTEPEFEIEKHAIESLAFWDSYKPILNFVVTESAPRAPAAATRSGLRLPKGSPLADRRVVIGIMALIFAAMCTVTLGFWRHLRRAYAPARRQMHRKI